MPVIGGLWIPHLNRLMIVGFSDREPRKTTVIPSALGFLWDTSVSLPGLYFRFLRGILRK